jgi:hypothetical protein
LAQAVSPELEARSFQRQSAARFSKNVFERSELFLRPSNPSLACDAGARGRFSAIFAAILADVAPLRPSKLRQNYLENHLAIILHLMQDLD